MTTNPPAASVATAAAAPPPAPGAHNGQNPNPGYCAPFDPAKEPWELFIERFDFYLTGYRLTNLTDKEKQGLFLNCCGQQVHKVARSIATPQSLQEVDWTRLRNGLQKHFAPKPSILHRRFTFFDRKQKAGESVANYLADIRLLAGDCEFGPELDDVIRDYFVRGLADDKLKRRLVGRPDCSLTTAIDEAMSAEASYAKQAGQVHQAAYEDYEEPEPYQDGDDYQGRTMRDPQDGDLHLVRTSRDPKMAAKNRQNPCAGCNGYHPRANCPFLHAVCSFCSKKGHIARACRAAPQPQPQPGPPPRGHRGNPQRRGAPNIGRWNPNASIRQLEGCWTIQAEVQQTSESKRDAGEFSTMISVQGKPCRFQIDSGSPATIISWEALKTLIPTIRKDELKPAHTALKDCQGKRIPLLGQHNVLLQYKDYYGCLPLIITANKFPQLLGRDWIRELGVTLEDNATINHTAPGSCSKDSITAEFQDVFDGELGKYKGTPISFSLDPTIPPIRCKPRRVPLAIKPKVDAQLDKLIAQGILIPIDYARWETPIVTPIKPDGSVRICADYKISINKALQWNAYPVPVIQHLLHSLGRGKIFAKLDLAQAYQQLPVDDQTAEAQTIVTHRGAFKCTRLQFGVSTAPGIFQSLMERLLQGIPGVTPYFDDVLVAADNPQELQDRLRTTLQKFRDAGLKLNKNKCLIGVPEVEFLGFKIDAAGIHPTQRKTAAIRNAPPPSNKTELQAFLGLLNFYSMFLKQKATVAEPLHRLLTKTATWKWGEVEQRAFQAVKALITSDSLLVQYNEATPVELTCDASPYGVGAVLSHVFPSGHSAPIAFYSRTLSAAERNYSQIDKEALAAIAGIKRFHDYLYGRKFTLVTDHKPLLGIISGHKQTPQVISPRMTRWIEFLAAYSYTLEHRPGTQIAHADALSRCPIPETTPDPAPTMPLLLLEHIPDNPVTAETIAKATIRDPTLAAVLQWVLKGWPPTRKGNQFKPFEARHSELSTQRGCLMWGHRVVIPPPLRSKLLTAIHEGHLGMVRMKALARSYVWWPGLDDDIEETVKRCKPCQEAHAAPPAAPTTKWDIPQNPWSRIHVDFAGPVQGHMLLITVDAHSNWTEVQLMKSTTTEATIAALQHTFTTHGIPDTLVSDNGPQFVAAQFETFLHSLGIRHTTSAPYRPMANGRAERAVRTTKDAIRRMQYGNLQQKINTFLLAQHSTPSPTTNRSPAELLMGRKIKIPLSRVHPDDTPPPPPTTDQRIRSFSKGEGVFTRNYPGPPKWIPGTINRPTGPRSYEVRTNDGRLWKRHLDQIRGRTGGEGEPRGEDSQTNQGGINNRGATAHCLPGARYTPPSAAEAQQPLFPRTTPSPPQPPPPPGGSETEEATDTSSPAGSSGSNEQSLRRSTRARLRPTYLKDYACAIQGSRTLHPRGEGCNVPRRRQDSLHSGPRVWTLDPTAHWLPEGRFSLAGAASQWEARKVTPRQIIKSRGLLSSSSYDGC